MVMFGTVIAADKMEINRKSAYLLELGEMPILTHLIMEMDRSSIREWSVVVGNDYDLHRRAAEAVSATMVLDEDWRKGFACSAERGLNEMPPQADAFIIVPGNLPFFSSADINAMVNAFNEDKGAIILAAYGEQTFKYALMHRKFFGEVKQRLSDGNFFELADDHPSEVFKVEVKNPNAFLEVVDTDSFEKAKKIFYSSDEYDSFANPQSRIPQ